MLCCAAPCFLGCAALRYPVIFFEALAKLPRNSACTGSLLSGMTARLYASLLLVPCCCMLCCAVLASLCTLCSRVVNRRSVSIVKLVVSLYPGAACQKNSSQVNIEPVRPACCTRLHDICSLLCPRASPHVQALPQNWRVCFAGSKQAIQSWYLHGTDLHK